MGKVRTDTIKRLAHNLYSHNPDYFSTQFQENKEKLKNVLLTPSKKVRNGVAGYLTRIARISTREDQGEEDRDITTEENAEQSS